MRYIFALLLTCSFVRLFPAAQGVNFRTREPIVKPCKVEYMDGCEEGKSNCKILPIENRQKGLAESDDMRCRRPIIVFDFGGVMGGTDKNVVAKMLASVLDLSQTEASSLMSELQIAKQQGISLDRFWKEYEGTSGKLLPPNWMEMYEEIRMEAIRAKPEMIHYVEALRNQGYRVAMLSNTTPSRADFIRKQGFYRYFEPVVLSCDIGVKKPQREAFMRLLDQLGVGAEYCILIDDKPENIEAACLLGIDGVLFTSVDKLGRELEKRGIRTACFES
jgi:putative hydrolase of the HAD superfamily